MDSENTELVDTSTLYRTLKSAPTLLKMAKLSDRHAAELYPGRPYTVV